jgi:Cyclin-dependent kinase inhibitor 3 (CDKN3)
LVLLFEGTTLRLRIRHNSKSDSESESAKTFRNNAITYNLHTVLVLTETNEFQKYAGADLFEFHAKLKLEVIHRPIVDFSIPEQRDMIRDIQDLTWRLAEGKSCLIYCAGGSGRTGMVIAGIIKNVGVKDPVAWVRRVKTLYCETADQEHFVNSLPAVVDARISQRYPMLSKAIIAEHILDTVISGKVTLSGKFIAGNKIVHSVKPSISLILTILEK